MTFKDFYGKAAPSRARRVEVVDGQVVGSGQSFGATTEGQPLTGAERAYVGGKMGATLAAIRAALATAKAKVDLTPNALVGTLLNVGAALVSGGLLNFFLPSSAPSEVKKNVMNGLLALENSIETKLAARIPDVYNGTLSPDRWFAMSQAYVDGIKSILDGIQEDNTANHLQTVIEGMAKDTASFLGKLKTGVERTFDFMPLIVGGAALLGTYLVVTRLLPPPRRRLSGYTGARKLRLNTKRK